MPNLPRDYVKTRERADRAIRNQGMRSVLRRNGQPDRPVSVVIQEYSAFERMGKNIDPIDRLCLLSALDPVTHEPLTIRPDRELDRLVTFIQPMSNPPVEDETLRFAAPPNLLNPGGVIVYFELRVRR